MDDKTVKFIGQARIRKPTETYSREMFMEACQNGSRWTLICGLICDLSTYLDQHPGGPQALKAAIGRDATQVFEGLAKFEDADARQHAHSRFATNKLSDLVVGILDEDPANIQKYKSAAVYHSVVSMSKIKSTSIMNSSTPSARRGSVAAQSFVPSVRDVDRAKDRSLHGQAYTKGGEVAETYSRCGMLQEQGRKLGCKAYQ
ncbi:hypothetical protein HK097_009374 [Rhizophlyctis rosea]|uniref:Cytochrome b5 heme-binding domain-containing protein n=1 Tax=Rhizophlyctis rosea TaxID=64517 RepID=A0AAD5SAM6_9FUNG|nr:hypothetical protein HK097_009374 [Rhizophlyctis rosea]